MVIQLNDYNIKVNIKYKKTNNYKIEIKNSELIEIRCPKYFNRKDIEKLIAKHQDWIFKHILSRIKYGEIKNDYQYNGFFYFLGKKKLIQNNLIRLKLKDSDNIKNEIHLFYRKELEKILTNMVKELTQEMRIPHVVEFKIRKMKKRWGTCYFKRSFIVINLFLIMLDLESIRSVVVHELAHFYKQNHSKEFYDLVRKYCKNYNSIKAKMKYVVFE